MYVGHTQPLCAWVAFDVSVWTVFQVQRFNVPRYPLSNDPSLLLPMTTRADGVAADPYQARSGSV